MSFPNEDSIFASTNRFMNEKLAYDKKVMTGEFQRLFISLADEQRDVYNKILKQLIKTRRHFFLYGYGGTGKTFFMEDITSFHKIRAKIGLNVTFRGIASLLLEGDRTAHSRFLIPINLTDDSTCLITRNPDICNLIKKTDLIIWDEALMIHKHAFEALDWVLKDILKCGNRNNCEHPFRGKVIVSGGDFRQILPVVQNGSKCKVLRLTKNMRLTVGCQASDLEETGRFSEWLLELGDGKLGGDNDEMVVLAPLNEVVQDINDRFLSLFPGEEVEYFSSDSINKSDRVGQGFNPASHSPDFLNSLKMFSMPNYRLVLKVGVPIMLLKNID